MQPCIDPGGGSWATLAPSLAPVHNRQSRVGIPASQVLLMSAEPDGVEGIALGLSSGQELQPVVPREDIIEAAVEAASCPAWQ